MQSVFARNALLDYLTGTLGSHISLHDGFPGDTGADEVAGGSYARQAAAFDAAAAGVTQNTNDEEFVDMPAVTILFAGYWDALSGGDFIEFIPLGSPLRGFASALASSDEFTSPAHGLNDDDRVIFQAVDGVGNMPTGISGSTVYYVVNAAAATFQVSLTEGGAAVNFTTDGDVMWIRTVPRDVVGGDTVRFLAGSLTLRQG